MGSISKSKADTPSVLEPKYEIKLLLKPCEALDSNHQLKSSIKEAFSVKTASEKMIVQFLDTNNTDIFKQDWIARIRKIQNENELELTYKKRYKIADGKIDAALELAAQQGFNSNNNIFKAQVDWGFKNQTLSVNRDEEFVHVLAEGEILPGVKISQDLLTEKAPEKFSGEIDPTLLQQARIYGPVVAERFVGTYDEDELDVELWPIRNLAGTGFDHIVEVSFKVRKYSKAEKRRKELMGFLDKKGWFLAEDSLRTTLILERHK